MLDLVGVLLLFCCCQKNLAVLIQQYIEQANLFWKKRFSKVTLKMQTVKQEHVFSILSSFFGFYLDDKRNFCKILYVQGKNAVSSQKM